MVTEEHPGETDGVVTEQLCCLVENSKPCMLKAGNASYGKKIQRTVQQRKLKLETNDKVGVLLLCTCYPGGGNTQESRLPGPLSQVPVDCMPPPLTRYVRCTEPSV